VGFAEKRFRADSTCTRTLFTRTVSSKSRSRCRPQQHRFGEPYIFRFAAAVQQIVCSIKFSTASRNCYQVSAAHAAFHLGLSKFHCFGPQGVTRERNPMASMFRRPRRGGKSLEIVVQTEATINHRKELDESGCDGPLDTIPREFSARSCLQSNTGNYK
jgi:hypothetical protein